jgi:hypothetical protein
LALNYIISTSRSVRLGAHAGYLQPEIHLSTTKKALFSLSFSRLSFLSGAPGDNFIALTLLKATLWIRADCRAGSLCSRRKKKKKDGGKEKKVTEQQHNITTSMLMSFFYQREQHFRAAVTQTFRGHAASARLPLFIIQ